MNKGKLRSLMFHAGFCNEDGGWDNRPIFEQEHDNFQRFAELIVRECIEKALEERVNEDLIDQEHDIEDRCYLRGSNGGIIDAVCAIKQHFGVEE